MAYLPIAVNRNDLSYSVLLKAKQRTFTEDKGCLQPVNSQHNKWNANTTIKN